MSKKTEEQKDLKKEKNTTKIATSKKSLNSSKKVNSKKVTKTSSVSNVSKKTLKNKKELKTINSTEYYDLPYRYNQTIVRVLAQTPTSLFIYWDISDEDRDNYKKQYGENFFETTRPVLIVHNDTLNYSFEVEINDFANSWYLHVNDSKSDYRIELGRRPIVHCEQINNDYIYITNSNEIESPNDHILFNNSQKMVYFRNIKTNQETKKDVSNLTFIQNMGKIYNIYDLYKQIYKDESIEDLSNPSSHTSSQLK